MEPLNILHLEDSETDAEIVKRLLKKEQLHFNYRLCMTREEYIDALEEFIPDVILADNSLPQFDAAEALNIANHFMLKVPFILVTGTMSEEFAVDMIKRGADDYILKDRLGRLSSAIDSAIKQRKAEKEKAEATDRLVQSEERYRTLVEQAFDGIIIYAPDGTILDCNLSACTYTGYSSGELKGFNVTKLFFKDELEARPLKFELLYSGHPTLDHRRLKRKDGASVDMEIATKTMPDGRLMAVGRDITERRKAQAQQALFASIVNSSDDAIISKNLDGVVTSWNRGAEALFGYTEKEMVGINISALVPADLSGEETAILKKISQGDYVQHYETVRLKKDGSRVFVSLTVSPVRSSKGIVVGASKIARDITERKAAEQKIIQSEINLKAIFDNTSEGFVLVDREGIVKAFNGKTRESIFVNSTEEMKAGKHIFAFVDDDRKDFFKKVMTNVLNGNTIQYDRAFNMGNGLFRWINFSLNPVVKDKKIDGFCITGRDITEKKIAEQEKEFTHNNLDALINNTHDLIWSIDKDFNLITSNLAFKKTVKLLSGTTILKGSSILIDTFGSSELTRYKEFYQRALAGETFTEVLFSNTPIGLWSEVSFYPIYEGSSVIGTACFSRNITGRKKAEEELKRSYAEKQVLAGRMATIINTLPANIALLDKNGFIVDVNEAWKSFADKNGFQSPHYAVGDNYIEIADASFGEDGEDGKKVASGIKKVLNKKIKAFEYEYPCHSPEVKRWFRMVVTPIAGREQGAVVMHVDISELRKLEAERMESKIEEQKNITQAMILGQEKERNAIGRELHDNMNQILAGVNLLLGMLRTKPERLDQYLPLCIEHINLAIKENRKIAHELVSPNQISESLINQIDRLCTNMLQNAGLETTIDHEKFDERLVHDDQKLAIYRVVQEQCTNIVKYAQAGQVEFKLSTTGNLLLLQIKDDGQGMKPGKATDGIGLQNMMSRVSVLNGKLKINTKPGKGFALHVEIPLA